MNWYFGITDAVKRDQKAWNGWIWLSVATGGGQM